MPFYVPRNGSVALSEDHMKVLLKRYDKDGDGRLSKKELQAAFRNSGLHFSGFRARRALHHADSNHDGFIGNDEMKELVIYAARWGFTVK